MQSSLFAADITGTKQHFKIITMHTKVDLQIAQCVRGVCALRALVITVYGLIPLTVSHIRISIPIKIGAA